MLILILLSFLLFGSPMQSITMRDGAKKHPTLQLPPGQARHVHIQCCGPDPIPPDPPPTNR